jgi:hypothetical protein
MRATSMTLCVEGIWRSFEDRLPIVIYTAQSVLSPAKFERCVLSDMNIKGTSVSPTLTIDETLVNTSSCSGISPYLCLPPGVHSGQFGIEVYRWRIAVNATLGGIYMMCGVHRLPHQSSHAFDDVLTPVFDRALVMVIPFHIFDSVLFPLPESQIIWHASHEHLYAIPVFEAWEVHKSVFFLQHVVIVHLHALVLDSTLDIFVLFTRRKRIVGIVL